jgi:hypothetical protein
MLDYWSNGEMVKFSHQARQSPSFGNPQLPAPIMPNPAIFCAFCAFLRPIRPPSPSLRRAGNPQSAIARNPWFNPFISVSAAQHGINGAVLSAGLDTLSKQP